MRTTMFCRMLCGLAMVASAALIAAPVAAEPRIALVIGNAAYPKGPLPTALGDGGLVAEALNSAGFEIIEGADVGQADLRRLLDEFLAKVEAAGPDAVAVVYFTGYGLEFEGENYLVPIDAQLERDADVSVEFDGKNYPVPTDGSLDILIDTVRVSDLLRSLASAPGRAKVVVIDAARPLPFEVKGAKLARGLAAVEAPPGLLIAMSSGPGTAAADGPGSYAAYPTAIAEMVREPGLDLDAMFAKIRVRTHQATEGRQTPWHVAALADPVVLVPGPTRAVTAAPGEPPPPEVRREPRPMREVGMEEGYAQAIELDALPSYVEFVQAYPQSPFAPRIWAVIRARREALAWERAVERDTPEAYWTYLRRYPHGIYAFEAGLRLRRLAALIEPPPSFAPIEFADVPPPLVDEPVDYVELYGFAGPPPPSVLITPPPVFFVSLPPPPRPLRPGFLPVPVRIPTAPSVGQRPVRPFAPAVGSLPPPGPPARPRPGILPRPPASALPGRPPLGALSPPPGPRPGSPPAGLPGASKRLPTGQPPGVAPLFRAPPTGPAVATTPPPGAPNLNRPPPAGVNRPPPAFANRPPPPAIANRPPPPAFVNRPPPPAIANRPPPPAFVNRPPPPPIVNRPPPPAMANRPPPPVVNRPPPPVVNRAPPAQAAKKCVVVNGQQVCR